MSYDPAHRTGRLTRLTPTYYRGRAFVHWSMTLEGRSRGWLDAGFHARIRELLCHSLGRYDLVCPAFCLMPDHGHFLWLGQNERSDQRLATILFRKAWNAGLRLEGRELQRQAFEHVLTDREREKGAVSAVAQYIFENPVRGRLVEEWKNYAFVGAVVPGYPDLDPRDEDFWERFRKIYAKRTEGESLTASATRPRTL